MHSSRGILMHNCLFVIDSSHDNVKAPLAQTTYLIGELSIVSGQ